MNGLDRTAKIQQLMGDFRDFMYQWNLDPMDPYQWEEIKKRLRDVIVGVWAGRVARGEKVRPVPRIDFVLTRQENAWYLSAPPDQLNALLDFLEGQ